MGEFREFTEKRFGYDSSAVGTATAGAKMAPTTSKTSEDTPISDTAANKGFMSRFCRVY